MLEQILESYTPGTYINIHTRRPAKTFKGCEHVIEKETVYLNARLGIGYDNLSQTQQKRQSGELPSENEGLVWGVWEKYPFIIQHNGKRYLRVYADKDKIRTTWIINGRVVSKSEVELYLLSSEKKEPTEDKYLTLSIKEETIIF